MGLDHLNFLPLTGAASKEVSYVSDLAKGMVDGLLLVLPRNPIDYVGEHGAAIISHLSSSTIRVPVRIVPQSVRPTGKAHILLRNISSGLDISGSVLSLAPWTWVAL